MACALETDDPEKAVAGFDQMPPKGQADPLSMFLLFKASLLSWNTDLGCQCVRKLAACDAVDGRQLQHVLYACIREAQQVGDKLCAMEALKAAAVKWDSAHSTGDVLSSVIQCGIRLIKMIEQDEPGSSLADETCEMFELGKPSNPFAN